MAYRCEDLNHLERRISFGRRDARVDEGSLQMTNDPQSIFYRHVVERLERPVAIHARMNVDDQDKLKFFEKYGPELVEFVKDRNGHLKSKFDKAFIT